MGHFVMDALAKGWYSELCDQLWPGQAMSIAVKEILHQEQTKFQKLEIMETQSYGRMLCLDGIIQLTEKDEFSYQEMLAFLPLFSHPNPKKVCVVGGGDGAILSRLVMHPQLEEIFLCELDERVIECSKKFFPQFRRGFDDPRVTILTSDGAKFLSEYKDYFDVIITDSSDPIGPADTLFSDSYYHTIHGALKEDGIAASQGECMWLHEELIEKLTRSCKQLFAHVEYSFVTIPTYPCGQIGVLCCSKGRSCHQPVVSVDEVFTSEDQDTLRYYTPDIHTASFVLPRFLAKRINPQ